MNQVRNSDPMYGTDVEPVDFDRCQVVVLPAPLEATVSYGGGTARGPQAILRASAQVELWDEWLGVEPWRAGVWTDPALKLADLDPGEAIECIADRCGALIDAGKWTVMLGGEHSVTCGGVQAAAARFEGLRILQLDAHADLRESYQGDRFNHACTAARCLEFGPLNALGVRSYSREEADRIGQGQDDYRILPAWEMSGPVEGWIDRALEGLAGHPVYLTVDLDYFDPAILPSTGTPEPGGVGWWSTLTVLEQLFERSNVVAADVVELAPVPGVHHPDFLAARLVSRLIGLKFRRTVLNS